MAELSTSGNTLRGELGAPPTILKPSRNQVGIKRCIVSLQEIALLQGLTAALLPKSLVTNAFQYLTTFLRQSWPTPLVGLWGSRSPSFVLHGARPILLSELVRHERPVLPAHFGPLNPRYLDPLRVVMTVVHYALIGTLVLQTELQRREFIGPYVPLSEYSDLTFLRRRPPPTDVSDGDDDDSTTLQAESVDPANLVADAMKSELTRLTSAMVSGRVVDLDREIVLTNALKLEQSPQLAATVPALASAPAPAEISCTVGAPMTASSSAAPAPSDVTFAGTPLLPQTTAQPSSTSTAPPPPPPPLTNELRRALHQRQEEERRRLHQRHE
eukprot:3334477-Pleurochrysis_carterae.AAC.3